MNSTKVNENSEFGAMPTGEMVSIGDGLQIAEMPNPKPNPKPTPKPKSKPITAPAQVMNGLLESAMPLGDMQSAAGTGATNMSGNPAAAMMSSLAGLETSEMPVGHMLGAANAQAVSSPPQTALELRGEWHLTLTSDAFKTQA